MKISKQEIKNLVKEVITEKKVDVEVLKEASDFTAKRKIIQAAQTASMEFEQQIASLLGLVNPDELQPVLQQRYLDAAESMKSKVVRAVAEAVQEFAKMPREQKETKGRVKR